MATPRPRLHLFVCANRREDSPLGPGCGDRGEALYAALKAEVARRGEVVTTWVTKTHCLGICPSRGSTVARYTTTSNGEPNPIRVAVDESAMDELLAPPSNADTNASAEAIEASLREIASLAELQTKKVLDLARRLRPGLTLEDVQNPHDFPELDDPDWHYADGVLTGIKAAESALRALARSRSS